MTEATMTTQADAGTATEGQDTGAAQTRTTDTGAAGTGGDGGQAGGNKGAPSPYLPAGLSPDFMKPFIGKTNEETIDSLAKALKGFREEQSKREPVPEKPDAYKPEWSDAVKDMAAGLGDDALFKETMAAAHKAGLTNTQFNTLFNGVFEAMLNLELIDKPVDIEAEKAKLAPPEARDLPPAERDAAIQRRVATNMAFIDSFANAGLDAEAIEALKLEMAAFPALNQLVELMRQPGMQPATGGKAPAGVTQDAIDARIADERSKFGSPKYDPSFVAETDRMMRQLYGE